MDEFEKALETSEEAVNPESETSEQENAQVETPETQAQDQSEKKGFFNKKQKQNADKKLEAELAEAKKATEELKNTYMRLAADFDNYKKRAQKESDAKYLDSRADTIKKFLPIIDSFERALALEAPEDAKAYAEGVKMIYDMFIKILKDNDVEEIDALNQTFDPEKHHAVMHIDDENFGENTVCEVFEKGYKMGDRILRYAVVKVAN